MDKPTQEIPDLELDRTLNAVPKAGTKPAWRDIAWLARYSLRGLWELVIARIAFARFTVRDLELRNRKVREMDRHHRSINHAHIARIGYVLPRLSQRLPWRSDCLVQAMAGQNWLKASGTYAEIQIGVERPDDGEFGAHAWLIQGGQVITGGDIARYAKIFGEESDGNDRSSAR